MCRLEVHRLLLGSFGVELEDVDLNQEHVLLGQCHYVVFVGQHQSSALRAFLHHVHDVQSIHLKPLLGWVVAVKQGLWNLPELADVGLSQTNIVFVFLFGLAEDIMLVRPLMEQVVVRECIGLLALPTEDQVDPFVEVLRCILGLKSLSKTEYDLLRTAGPVGTLDVVDLSFVLLASEFKLVTVTQELRPRVELWNKLLEVGCVFGGGRVLVLNAREESVGMIEPLALMLPVQRSKRLQPDEVVSNDRWIRVEATIQELGG